MKTFTFVVVVITLSLFSGYTIAQEKYDTLPENYKRNVVKWNMTPFLLWSSQNLNFSYERAIKPYQSFSVNAGYFVLPSTGVYDNLNIKPATKNSGFSISGDYRFYFKGRNTRNAPDGLYWGPYASFHHYQFQNSIEITNRPNVEGGLALDGKFNVISAGVQLGYQFVLKKNFTIDLIFMGPSLSMYSGQLKLEGDLTVDENDEYLKAVRDILLSRFPFLGDLIEDGTFDSKGVTSNLGPGLRYMIQIGYRF